MHWHRRARRSVFSRGSVFAVCALGVAVAAGSGCGLSTQEGGGAAEVIKKPELLCVRAGADRVEASSIRGDGKNDIFKVFVHSSEAAGGVVLSCKELDLNGDGRKDMLVYYDSRGRKLREEFDHDFDGVADMKSFYEGGQLVRQELDVDFDGKPDLVEYFENGKRVRLEKILAPPPTVAAAGKTETPGPRTGASGEVGPGTSAPTSGEATPSAVPPASSGLQAPTYPAAPQP